MLCVMELACELLGDLVVCVCARCPLPDDLVPYPLVTQHQFLKVMGLDIRLESLSRRATSGDRELLRSQYDRLLDPQGMGSDFKVFVVGRADSELLPGFSGSVRAGDSDSDNANDNDNAAPTA